ncbi:MAG: hypothetical protein KA770_13625, partial [Shewanella sp.]|nr:hypothetical protein [Shewanella sp.]
FLAKSIPITLISMMETSRTICQLQAWHNTASLGAEASITSLQTEQLKAVEVITHKQQKRSIASVPSVGGAAPNCGPCWQRLHTSTGQIACFR